MPQPIKLPHVGESVTEAVIGKWLKKPGDRVQKFDPIVEVVTDKVSMEVPSPASGTLTRIVAVEGATVLMGAVIAEMEVEGATHSGVAPGSYTPPQHAAAPAAPGRVGAMVMGANVGPTGGLFQDTSLASAGRPSTTPMQPGEEQDAGDGQTGAVYSPVVLKLAAQHDIDVATVRGTGLGGRVTRKDIMDAVARGQAQRPASLPAAGPFGEDRIIEPSPVRKIVAAHMVRSFREIPHAWSAIEVDMTGVVACRAARREQFKAAYGIDLTYLPFTAHAVAQSLKANPVLNSSWEDGKVRLKGRVNLGVAVAATDGLVVPVLKDADTEDMARLAVRLASLVTRAREGRLGLEDVQGGTFTLNNTGALGSVWGGAIINYPQAAILTTEAIVKRPSIVPEPDGDRVTVRSMMNICLSFDHRVMDGAEAAAFMQDVRRRLEAVTVETRLE